MPWLSAKPPLPLLAVLIPAIVAVASTFHKGLNKAAQSDRGPAVCVELDLCQTRVKGVLITTEALFTFLHIRDGRGGGRVTDC